jgi:hypothetical protein
MAQVDIAFVAGIFTGVSMGVVLTCAYVLFLARKHKA